MIPLRIIVDNYQVVAVNDVSVPAGYKSTDVGVVPEDWLYIPFKSVLSVPLRNGIYKAHGCHGQGIRVVNMG